MTDLALYVYDRKARAEFPDDFSGFVEADRIVRPHDNVVVKQGTRDGVPAVLIELEHDSILVLGEDPNAFASNWSEADFAADVADADVDAEA